MAGSGRRTFTPGEVLTASNVMNYLQDQAVMNFAGTAARGSAIGSAVSQGMVSYLDDSNSLEVYKTVGTAIAGWEPVNLAQSPNVIINGAFDINQRNFTSTTTSGTYGFDRWLCSYAGGTSTYSAQAFTPGSAPAAAIEGTNYARVVTTGQSAAGDYTTFQQRIESVRTLAGQTATISFWAKAASGTPKVAVDTIQNFGIGGSPSANVTTLAGQVTLSTSWARYSVTIALPSISGKTLGTTVGTNLLQIQLWLSAGSTWDSRTGTLGIQSNTFDIWGVQVEAGSTATPFRRNAPSIQAELAACQRYYYRLTAGGTYTALANGFMANSTIFYAYISLPVTMRTNPNILDWSGTYSQYTVSGTTINSISTSSSYNSRNLARVAVQLTVSYTSGYSAEFRSENNTTAYVGFDAEL